MFNSPGRWAVENDTDSLSLGEIPYSYESTEDVKGVFPFSHYFGVSLLSDRKSPERGMTEE